MTGPVFTIVTWASALFTLSLVVVGLWSFACARLRRPVPRRARG